MPEDRVWELEQRLAALELCFAWWMVKHFLDREAPPGAVEDTLHDMEQSMTETFGAAATFMPTFRTHVQRLADRVARGYDDGQPPQL